MQKQATLIAVVDDEESVRKALKRLLHSNGFNAEMFADGSAFLQSLSDHHPDCLILDIHMPNLSGLDVQQALAEMQIHLPVIIVTGNDSAEDQECAMARGAAYYLRKPVAEQVLLDAIRALLLPGQIPPCQHGKPT